MSLPNFDLNPNRSEANSFVSYVGDGVTKEYRFDIDYLRREFIKVEINGIRQTGWVFKEDRVIILAQPVPVEDILTIKRITDATRIVEFIDGSILKSRDLNISAIQTVHISEEARDYMTNTVGVDDEGNIDARFKRVVRVQNAVDDFDATNKRYVDSEGQFAMANAHASATAAKASENAAKVSEGKAKDSETKGKASEVAAKDSETKAKAYEVAAAASAKNAKDSENVVVPLVPVVDQASKDAASAAQMADDASKRAEQAVVDVKNLGAVPLGAVLVFIKEPLPAGYLALRGGKFDPLTFPDLFELLGTDDLPDFTDRVPKMVGSDLTLLEKQGWCWPQHSHTWGGQTDTHGGHNHNRGDMEISAAFAVDWGRPGVHATGAIAALPVAGGTIGGSTLAGGNGFDFYASRSWTGHVSWNGDHFHQVSGATSQAGNSDRVDVDRIGVIYAIKAAGVVATEGMAQLDSVLNRVGDLEAYNTGTVAPELNRLGTLTATNGINRLGFQTENSDLPVVHFDGDLNSITRSGVYNASPTAANSPYPSGWGFVQHFTHDHLYAVQIFTSMTSGVYMWQRQKHNGTWSVWLRLQAVSDPVVETLWTGSHGSAGGNITLSSKLRDGDMIGLYHSVGTYLVWTTVAKAVQAHHAVKFGVGGYTNFLVGDDYQTLHSFSFTSGYAVNAIYRIRYNR